MELAGWFVGPVMTKIIDGCFDFLLDQVGWQMPMKKELERLRENHPKIQAVVYAANQAQISDQNPALNKWIWQLRDAIDEADDVLDELEYMKHKEQITKNTEETKKRKFTSFTFKSRRKILKIESILKRLKEDVKKLEFENMKLKEQLTEITKETKKRKVTSFPYESTSKILKIGERGLKIDPNLKRLEESVQKLDKVSADVTTFLPLLDCAKLEQKEQEVDFYRTRETGYLPKNDLKIGERGLKIDPNLKRLEEAVQKLDKVSADVTTFLPLLDCAKLEQKEQEVDFYRTRETGYLPKNDLIGRVKEKERVMEWLRNPSNEHLGSDLYRNISLLSIVGHGGMGKTTLVHRVYKDDEITNEFDLKMWVCVSNNFDVKRVIADMLESLKKKKPNLDSLDALQGKLKKELMSKRFLLVLDDVWEEEEARDKSKWENVLASLADGGFGSKIMVTTQTDSVAQMFAKVIKKKKEIVKLQGLEEDECLHLLNSHAFAGLEKELVMGWLRNPSHDYQTTLYRNISLLCIMGHGGMGNTTLFQQIYEDERTKDFDLKMWVCVSNKFDVKKVIADMLEYLDKKKPDLDSLDALQGRLQIAVRCKKFLLILDDIWVEEENRDISKWENVLAPLAYGKFGSRILATTQEDSFAMMIGTVIKKKTKIFRLDEKDHCLQLLNSHAFAGVENLLDDYKKLRAIAGEIVKKILRSPLAAKVIGGVLNDNLDERHWREVLESNLLDQNPIVSILKLSYIALPNNLKNCFAFCCMFPHDHKFDKDDLVRMWIALGFIQPSQGMIMEDIGGRYFDVLIKKNLFDMVGDDYKMHNLIHESASIFFAQECYKLVDDEESSLKISETIRHLSVQTKNPSIIKKIGQFKYLHSLLLFNKASNQDLCNALVKIFKASRSLRLLYMDPSIHLNKIPEEIGNLGHLRYLKIVGVDVTRLPRSLSKLLFLKSLELEELPKVKWLQSKFNGNDKHYAFPSLEVLIIRRLEALEDWLEAGVAAEDGYLFPCLIELVIFNCPKLKELSSLPTKLKSLHIENTGWKTLNFCSNSNPIHLETLEVYDCPNITSLPLADEIARLAALRYLKIKRCPNLISLGRYQEVETTNNCHLILNHLDISDPSVLLMEPLRSIAALQNLKIEDNDEVVSFPNEAEQWFLNVSSSLCEMEFIRLKSLVYLPSSLESSSSLQILSIYDVPMLRELPNLPPSLQRLTIRGCHPELKERYGEDGGSDRHKIAHILNIRIYTQ